MKNWLFGSCCDSPFCFKKPWRWMCITFDGSDKKHFIGYCEYHARIIDEMMRKGEIDLSSVEEVVYHPLES